ncbi:NAD(P)H-dependent oxidoreductase [bacterium]|nr:NAD(P)H-dependent oxidoreductase [bacterium]
MPSMLIACHSRGGNTMKLANAIAEGASAVAGVEVAVKRIAEVSADDLRGYDAILLGSPTYYGLPAAEVKKLIDDSVAYHGQLEGKVGGAFATSANIAGGNETTVMAILQALLIHGMVVQGTATGDHYGPVGIGSPDARAEAQGKAYGERLARLTKKLHA